MPFDLFERSNMSFGNYALMGWHFLAIKSFGTFLDLNLKSVLHFFGIKIAIKIVVYAIKFGVLTNGRNRAVVLKSKSFTVL